MATIRIFIKGLKNAPSLATCIYEKGPQMLSDAISEVEKLNAVQQLTATITSPSTVNMMSNDDDRCFQCQEHGHIARNCPNIRCFECDEYGHIVMDSPHKIPPLGTPAKHHQSKLHKSYHARSCSRHHNIEAILGHNIGIVATIKGVAHNTQIPHTGVIAINPTVTHLDHTADHPCTEADHTTPEIQATHVHIHPTNHQGEIHIGCTHAPVDHEANHITGRMPE